MATAVDGYAFGLSGSLSGRYGGRVLDLGSPPQFMLMGLEAHHVSEDELLWPRLAERTTLDGLAADLRPPLGERVAAQLGEPCSVLNTHMDEEENTVLPPAAECV